MNRQRRTPTPPYRRGSAKSPTIRRRLAQLTKPQLVFSVLGLLVVCSLVAASLGTFVVDALIGQGTGDIVFDPEEEGEYVAQLRERVADNPEDVEGLLLLANALENQGEPGESFPFYERAIALAPDDARARFDFGFALSEGGKVADAELQFQKALQLQPDYLEAHYYLAELYRQLPQPRSDEAAALYRRVIELAPDSLLATESATHLQTLGFGTPLPVGTPATPFVGGSA